METGPVAARIAAVVFDRTTEVDVAMARAVALLRRRGIAVGGLLQHFDGCATDCARPMWLEDAATGTRRRIDRPRGGDVAGCVLDPDALAAASCDLQAVIASGCDLLIINRFGKSEAAGGGLRAEIAQASLSGTPLLIAIRDDMLPAWEAFLGGPSLRLPPEPTAMVAWAEAVLALPAGG